MYRFPAILIACVLGSTYVTPTFAQMDPMGAIEQLQLQANQNVNRSQNQAVQMYRKQTGDYRTPDHVVVQYLLARARQQNPQWYADYQQRQSNFQRHQSQYSADRNSQLDQSHNDYMNRSQRQQQGHDSYVRENIRNESLYGDNQGNVYQLPQYRPYQAYETNDGRYMTQDGNGRYHQFDRNGW
jgi:LmbE family N-acetylglucosaminyl deacetylase